MPLERDLARPHEKQQVGDEQGTHDVQRGDGIMRRDAGDERGDDHECLERQAEEASLPLGRPANRRGHGTHHAQQGKGRHCRARHPRKGE